MSSQIVENARGLPLSLSASEHISAMKAEIDFLAEVEKYPLLSTPGPVLNNAIRRYETVFLPALAKANKKGTISGAPLDVQWVWHCHMLSPIAYRADCQKLVEYIPDHAPVPSPSSHDVQQIWTEYVDEEPFRVDITTPSCGPSSYLPQSSWDPIAAVTRQKEIYYGLSLPHYRDDMYLSNGILRYKMLLQLQSIKPSAFLIPCYDIDLALHTHLLHPVIYYQDTVSYLGKMFRHGDDGSGNCAEEYIDQSIEATRKLWQETYNMPMAFNGAMSRGPSPAGKLGTMTATEVAAPADRLFHINIDIQVQTENPRRMMMVINLGRSRLAKREIKKKLKGSSILAFGEYKRAFSLLEDSGKTMTLTFSQTEEGCCMSSDDMVHIPLNIDDYMQGDRGENQTIKVEEKLLDSTIFIQGVAAVPVVGSIHLTLNAGAFSNVVMPETVESIWGPVPLRRLPAGAVNHCTVANHVLSVRGSSQKLYTARVIHSQPLLMSCVQIYFRDRMVAVSHLVGTEQLPEDSNSMGVCGDNSAMILNRKQRERAMLIKTSSGDKAIIYGQWAYSTTNASAAGYLRFKITRCLDNCSWRSDGSYYITKHHIVINDMRVDKRDGKIEIEKPVDVGEKLCMAFTVAVLTCLCQPPPPGIIPPKDANKLGVQAAPPRYHPTKQGISLSAYNDGAALNFITAAGWMMPVPSNFYRKHHSCRCTVCGGKDGDTCLCLSPF